MELVRMTVLLAVPGPAGSTAVALGSVGKRAAILREDL